MISFVVSEKNLVENSYALVNKENLNSFKSNPVPNFGEDIFDLEIGLLTDFTNQPIIQAVNLASRTLDYNSRVHPFPSESIIQILLDKGGDLYKKKFDFILVYPDYSKFQKTMQLDDISNYELAEIAQLLASIRMFQSLTKTKVILASIPFTNNPKMNTIIKKFNQIIRKENNPNFQILRIDFEHIHEENWFDLRMLSSFRIPFSPKSIPIVAASLITAFRRLLNHPIKMIITDLDGTLWDGILAEEDVLHFKKYLEALEPTQVNLALALRHEFEKGVALAIATKNDQKKVEQVLDGLLVFPLKFQNFFKIEANWDKKSESVKRILSEIGFNPRNAIYFDDSPLECIEVKANIPGIQVMNIVNSESVGNEDFVEFGLFNSESLLTQEDILRNESYEIAKKISVMAKHSNVRDYLLELNQNAQLTDVLESNYLRINQMHERTNQFRANLNMFIPGITNESKQKVLQLSDKFLDYGIVGFIEWQNIGGEILITQWIMSCRVFNRDLETFTLKEILNLEGLPINTPITIKFHDSGKNLYFKSFLEKIGLSQIEQFFRGIPVLDR